MLYCVWKSITLKLGCCYFLQRLLRICLLQGRVSGGLGFWFKVGCLTVVTHDASFRSSPCLDLKPGDILCQRSFLWTYVKVHTSQLPRLGIYTWILGTIRNPSQIEAAPPPQPMGVCVRSSSFSSPCVVLKPGRQGSTGKGTFPGGSLKKCWCFCSFLPSQFQPVSPQAGPASRTLCDTYASNLHFCLMLKDHMAHLSVIGFADDEAWEKFQVCNHTGRI